MEKNNEESIETMMSRLEEINRKLKSSDTELEKCVELFKQGKDLIDKIKSKLDALEGEIKEIAPGEGDNDDPFPR